MNHVEMPELPEPHGINFSHENTFSAAQIRHYALESCADLQLQLASLTEDYKDLEAQLLAVGAGGVSKLIGDKE